MKELLVPVGSMEALVIAIKSGADAVYLAGKKYGARASAANFDNEEMIQAIKLCHLYGVKIYVTVNTLIYESEIYTVIDYVRFLYESGVDAVIVQDLGLISYLKKAYPNLEIHASTQVHTTNADTLKFLSELGVKRVVLAREVSLEEIRSLNTDMELEVFVHGALCISYSGQCLFSSRILNRSGNRGECAQMCRLPYKLYEEDECLETNGNYLISPKELNTSRYFKEIMESNILSLKIEGRMKSPEYVGCVTKFYRALIDEYYKTGECHVDSYLLDDISLIFNRDFTKGFLFNADYSEIMNVNTSNHQGLYLGKVINVSNKFIHVKLERDLHQGDGIRFCRTNEGMICNYIYDRSCKLISRAKKGDVILLDKRFDIKLHDKINKTFDVIVRDKYINIEDKKIPISIYFKAHLGSSLFLRVSDGKNTVGVTYGNVEVARNLCTSDETIIKQLKKLGNTPFITDDITLDVQNSLFINIKDINELRRMATNKLISVRENSKREVVINDVKSEDSILPYDEKKNISILVRNEEQLKYLLDKDVRIYVPNLKLYEKYKTKANTFYRTNRVSDNVSYRSLVTELGSLKNGGVGDYFLNVTNHETVNLLSRYLDIITLSCELDDEEIEKLMLFYNNNLNVELVVYGRLELMLMKYCPLNYLVNKDKVCHVCTNNKKYYLVSENGNTKKKYPIVTDPINHTTHILNHEVISKIDRIPYYKSIGINNYRIELFDETLEEIDELMALVKEKIC